MAKKKNRTTRTVIMNGRTVYDVTNDVLTHADIAKIAMGDKYRSGHLYTIMVDNPATNCGESVDPGVSVRVVDGMVFSVVAGRG